MIKFDNDFFSLENVLKHTSNRVPDFENILRILRRGRPGRPTLFEFFLNDRLYQRLTGRCAPELSADYFGRISIILESFRKTGYDYVTLPATFSFTFKDQGAGKSISQNETAMITDRDSFDRYPWPDVESIDFSYMDRLESMLCEGMKYISYAPGGVLENTTMLLGYENMCYSLYDDPLLVSDVFERVGEILYAYFDKVIDHPSVGAGIFNDDWGYRTQTMLNIEDMRKYVIPWHKKVTERIHKAGKPAILHSCGRLDQVYDDVIDYIGFDGKHSYEDAIQPVEDFYEEYKDRIAVLGGIDLDYVCTKSPEKIFKRSSMMLENSLASGGYALGTGNSVPEYVPDENYFALILAALVKDAY